MGNQMPYTLYRLTWSVMWLCEKYDMLLSTSTFIISFAFCCVALLEENSPSTAVCASSTSLTCN